MEAVAEEQLLNGKMSRDPSPLQTASGHSLMDFQQLLLLLQFLGRRMKVAGLSPTAGGERKERRIEIEEPFLPRKSSTLSI